MTNKYRQIASDNLMDIITSKKILGVRGLSFGAAVDAGLNPSVYQYRGLSTGVVEARLDFKIWNKGSSLSLHFTDLKSNKPFKIGVFKNKDSDTYSDRSGNIDFSAHSINGSVYEIEIVKSGASNFAIKTAKLIFSNEYFLK